MALLVVCAGVYAPVWDNEFVNFDDGLFIYQDELIRSLDLPAVARLFELQILTPFYKPLVYLSWALEYHFFGLDPRAYHLNNLLLHLANVALLYLLLLRLARVVPGATTAGPRLVLLVTALFALHPMKVESVAWATERKDVLFAFFFLASLSSYVAYLTRRRTVFLAASCLLFLLGTLSKAAIVSLPPVLLLVDFLLRRRDWRRIVLDKLPHVAILLLALALYGLLGRPPAATPHPSQRVLLVAAESASPGRPSLEAGLAEGRSERLARQTAAAGYRVLGFSAHLLWPRDLAAIYPVPDALTRVSGAGLATAVLGLALVTGLVAWALRRFPVAGAGGVFFLLTLAPSLAAPVFGTNFLSDRYTYLPSIGFWVAVVAAGVALARALPRIRAALIALAVVYLAGLAVAAYRQVDVWQDSVTLWTAVIERQGEMPVALNNRGVAFQERGELEAAGADFERALALDPLHFKAYNNRALARHELGDTRGALMDLDRAIGLQPDTALLYRNRGVVAVDAGHVVEGIADYTRAIALEPERAEAYLLRGVARQKLGDFDGAIADLDRVLAIGGLTVEALFQRGVARMRSGDYAGAVEDNTRVLALDPADARAFNNRGFARFYLGSLEPAIRDFDRAISLDASYAIAYRNRGDARSALGDLEAGCSDWGAAKRLGAAEATGRLEEFCVGPG